MPKQYSPGHFIGWLSQRPALVVLRTDYPARSSMKCVVIASVVATAFAVSACDGDDTTAPEFPPEVSITAPDDGSTYDVSDAITFRGAATDPDGGIIDSLIWTSSVDGRLGAGSPLTVTLSVGTHIVTLRAYDDEGASGQAFVSVDVVGPPSVVITAPADSSRFLEGADVTFTADASDPDGGQIDSLVWTSSQDGRFGEGASVSLSSLRADRYGSCVDPNRDIARANHNRAGRRRHIFCWRVDQIHRRSS